jgi:hypothetical protein
MDQETSKSLRQALNFLKSGNSKAARSLLVEILKKYPDSEQAWYMLSFAVPNRERQIYALNQVLRIDPWHEKALNRMEKFTGESHRVEEPPFERSGDITPATETTVEPESQEDLLAQRLFSPVDEIEEEKTEDDEPPPFIIEDEDESGLAQKPIVEEKAKTKKPKKPKKSRKPRKPILKNLLSRVPRRTLLLITLVVVFGGISFLIYNGNINFGDFLGSTQTPLEQAQTPTSTHIPEPTPTLKGGGLPPTWTPASPESSSQPFFGDDSLFTVTSLSLPSAEVAEEILLVQSEVASQRFEQGINIESFLISDPDFQQLLKDFSSFPGYQEYVDQRELIYRALGLANSWDELYDFPPNLWSDPNGGIYLIDEKANMLQAESFDIIQRFLYARGYAQALLDGKFSLEGLGVYPICFHGLQQCEVILALIKGDASLQANQWLEGYGPIDQAWKVHSLEPSYINLPFQSPPPFVEKELEFPYSAGLDFVKTLFDSGEWELVNSAYIEMPSTTEQILHPEKYLSGEQALEIDDAPLSEELNDNWVEIINEPLGEWLTYIMLAYGVDPNLQIPTDTAQEAASGWGADQTQIYHNSISDQFVVSAHWVWDTQNDATQFSDVLLDYINLRFKGAEAIELHEAECWRTMNESTCVIKDSSEVIWLIAPDMDIMDVVIYLFSNES